MYVYLPKGVQQCYANSVYGGVFISAHNVLFAVTCHHYGQRSAIREVETLKSAVVNINQNFRTWIAMIYVTGHS